MLFLTTREPLIEAWEHVVEYSLDDADTSIASKKQWEAAKEELRQSLWDSMQDKNKGDHTSRSAESVSEVVPSVRVGYSSGLLQIGGLSKSMNLSKRGTRKTQIKSQNIGQKRF